MKYDHMQRRKKKMKRKNSIVFRISRFKGFLLTPISEPFRKKGKKKKKKGRDKKSSKYYASNFTIAQNRISWKQNKRKN